MSDQHRHIAERVPKFGPNRELKPIRLRWRHNVMSSRISPDQEKRCRKDQTAARHPRANTYLVELLEARWVPSALGHFSLSGLAPAIQSTTTNFIANVVSPSDLSAPVVLQSPNLEAPALRDVDVVATATVAMLDSASLGPNLVGSSPSAALPIVRAVATTTGTVLDTANSVVDLVGVTPSHAFPVEGVVSTATGTVLERVNLIPNPVVASPAPVQSPIDVELGSQVASTGNATSGGVEALLAPVVSSIDFGLGSTSEGHATEAQAVSPAPGAGLVTIQTAAPGATALGAVYSTTGATDSVTTSSLVRGMGDEEAAGGGRLRNVPGLTGPSSIDPQPPTGPSTAPAELLASDLESIERAVGQLMRQFDEIRADLADWLTQIGTAELLLTAGMVGLACELSRRWERRRQLAKPHTQFGASSRPGPFYRRRACPFARPGSSTFASGPAIL
jgi:hypothetical protein